MNKNTVFSTQMLLITQMNALAWTTTAKKRQGQSRKKVTPRREMHFFLWDEMKLEEEGQPVSCGEYGLKKPK